MKKTRKSQIQLIVTITLLLAGFFVILEVVRDATVGNSNIKNKEMSCKAANQMAQKTDIDLVHKAALKSCSTIDLGTLPMSGYSKDQEGVKKNIADKAAKAWEIWLEGTKEDYFDNNIFGSKQKCFIQYTFNIKKGLEPISSAEFEEFLYEEVYKVGDSSDRCAGTKGGFCKTGCDMEETRYTSSKGCIGSEGACCLKETKCESKGGICSSYGCSDLEGFQQYSHTAWLCKGEDVCCIDDSNYLTYLKYVQANTGAITMKQQDLYPQDYSLENGKVSETYAIVFASRTTNRFIWESVAGCGIVGFFVGGGPWGAAIGAALCGAGMKGVQEIQNYGEAWNINRIIIAPLKDVENECSVQLSTEA